MDILVVEDFVPLREALARGLAREGYSPQESGDGGEALARALGGNPGLIVLDAMLPSLDGFEFVRRFRGEGRSTPILMLTARDALADRVAGLDAGADDYMVKPFAFSEFLARVRALSRRPGSIESHPAKVGDLRLDPLRRTVFRGEEEIVVTPREYELLALFLAQVGRPIPSQDLHRRLYGGPGPTGSNVVEVLVGTLRRKLEAGGKPRILHTRRGFGYVLESP